MLLWGIRRSPGMGCPETTQRRWQKWLRSMVVMNTAGMKWFSWKHPQQCSVLTFLLCKQAGKGVGRTNISLYWPLGCYLTIPDDVCFADMNCSEAKHSHKKLITKIEIQALKYSFHHEEKGEYNYITTRQMDKQPHTSIHKHKHTHKPHTYLSICIYIHTYTCTYSFIYT